MCLVSVVMAEDCGISLDPYSVLQRHSLEDSDDEGVEEKNAEFVAVPDGSTSRKSRVIFAFGTAAFIFTNSYFGLKDAPANQIQSSHITVFKDKFFLNSAKEKPVVSEVYGVHCRSGNYSLCIHKSELKSFYCKEWCSLVCVRRS